MNTPSDTTPVIITTTTAAAPASPGSGPSAPGAHGELLTQVQLAARLGISRRTLNNWVRDRAVPMIKLRGYCRFDYAKVRAVLDQHEQPVACATCGRPGVVAPCPSAVAAPEAATTVTL